MGNQILDFNVNRSPQWVTLLPSATRTITTTSADFINTGTGRAQIFFNITAVTAAENITLTVQGKDEISNTYANFSFGEPISAVSLVRIILSPGSFNNTQVDSSNEELLPRIYRVRIVPSGSGNFTYSVGAVIL